MTADVLPRRDAMYLTEPVTYEVSPYEIVARRGGRVLARAVLTAWNSWHIPLAPRPALWRRDMLGLRHKIAGPRLRYASLPDRAAVVDYLRARTGATT